MWNGSQEVELGLAALCSTILQQYIMCCAVFFFKRKGVRDRAAIVPYHPTFYLLL